MNGMCVLKDFNFKSRFACLIVIFVLCISFSHGQSPTSFGKRVKGLPEKFLDPNESLNSGQTDKKTKLPWVVFSDRADNVTTTSPGGSLMMEKLSFMQPFYVSEERDGYVKLLKYNENMVKGLKLNNKKGTESLGWLSKNKLLLWQKSYVDVYTRNPKKALAIIRDVEPLINPQFYFDKKDSIYVYDNPDLKNVRSKIALHNYVYIYKKSENGQQYLIGTTDQFVSKEASKYMKGWVSSHVVEDWGGSLYVVPSTFQEPEVSQVVSKLNIDNITKAEPYKIDPLSDTSSLILSGLPVNKDENNVLYTSYATDVYNKDFNKLLTINGSELTYNGFINLIKNRSKVNIIYVIDGGSSMRQHFSSLQNTISSFENIINSVFNARDVKYASVIYRNQSSCNSGNAQLPLTDDYRRVLNFLKQQSAVTENCKSASSDQPLFSGLEEATRLVGNVAQQTNLFIVIGSTGNLGGSNKVKMSSLARRIADVDGRMLVLQAYNQTGTTFSDFIVQSRNLVSSEAYYVAEKRKFQLVRGEAFGNQTYDFNLTDSISYYLDFPKNSLVQGGVVFPSRGSTLNNRSYAVAVQRLLTETKWDINSHIKSLDSAFRLTGIENKNVSSSVRSILGSKFNERVGDNMPHNTFKFSSAIQLRKDVFVDTSAYGVEYDLILNQNEYKQMMEILSVLVGDNLLKDDVSFRKKLYKNYLSIVRQNKQLNYTNSVINSWTLQRYFDKVIGLPLKASSHNQHLVNSLRKRKKMPLKEFEEYISYLQQVILKIKAYTQSEGKFTSNGQLYYRIKGSFFDQKPANNDSN